MRTSLTIQQFEISFWATCLRSTDDACWPWTGACNRDGYGVVSWLGTTMLAHRIAWILAFRQNIAGLKIRHTCPSHACCNPAHLKISV